MQNAYCENSRLEAGMGSEASNNHSRLRGNKDKTPPRDWGGTIQACLSANQLTVILIKPFEIARYDDSGFRYHIPGTRPSDLFDKRIVWYSKTKTEITRGP